MPATKDHLDFETAIANEYLCLVQVLEMPPDSAFVNNADSNSDCQVCGRGRGDGH